MDYTREQEYFHEALVLVLTAGISVSKICDAFAVSRPIVERWRTKVNLPHSAMCTYMIVKLLENILKYELEIVK